MRIRRSASRRPPSVPVGPQEAWWAAPKAPGSPDLLVAFRCGQAPRLSWPCARYSPAHGVNAGRDTPDMASCADYGVVSGYNDDFPQRGLGDRGDEQVLPADGVPARGRPNRGRSAPVRDFNKNMFQC